jgi:hypothetical protein
MQEPRLLLLLPRVFVSCSARLDPRSGKSLATRRTGPERTGKNERSGKVGVSGSPSERLSVFVSHWSASSIPVPVSVPRLREGNVLRIEKVNCRTHGNQGTDTQDIPAHPDRVGGEQPSFAATNLSLSTSHTTVSA